MGKRKKSMFYENPKHKDIARIVKIDSPANARKAAAILTKKFRNARTRDKKRAIKQSMILAANRAKAMMKRKNLSSKERKEMKEVSKIYRNVAKKLKLGVIIFLLLLSLSVVNVYAADPGKMSGSNSVSIASNNSLSPTRTKDVDARQDYLGRTVLNTYYNPGGALVPDIYHHIAADSQYIHAIYYDEQNDTLISGVDEFTTAFYSTGMIPAAGSYITIDESINWTAYNSWAIALVFNSYNETGILLSKNKWGDPANSFTIRLNVKEIVIDYEYGAGSNNPWIYTHLYIQLYKYYMLFVGVKGTKLYVALLDCVQRNFSSFSHSSANIFNDNVAGQVYIFGADGATSGFIYGIFDAYAFLHDYDDFMRIVYYYKVYYKNRYIRWAYGGLGLRYINASMLILGAQYKYFNITLWGVNIHNLGTNPYWDNITIKSDVITTIRYFYTPYIQFIKKSDDVANITAYDFNYQVYINVSDDNIGLEGVEDFWMWFLTYSDENYIINGVSDKYLLTSDPQDSEHISLFAFRGNIILPDVSILPTRFVVFDFSDYTLVTIMHISQLDYNTYTWNTGVFRINVTYAEVPLVVGYYLIAFKNETHIVYVGDGDLYITYVQEEPQIAKVIINYFDVNNGLGVAFNTFKTYVNKTRVFYNVLEYTLYSTLVIETYDYFDVLIANNTYVINDTTMFIDIGINLTTVYLSNQRDENVTFKISSNDRNLTITLPPNYVKMVTLVARNYVVYVISRSIGILRFNLTTTVNDNIILVKGDRVIKQDANPQVLTIASVAQQAYLSWASNGLIFGVFSTIGSFLVGLVMVHILRKRRKKVVIYKTSLF